jgi:hypothetical protein
MMPSTEVLGATAPPDEEPEEEVAPEEEPLDEEPPDDEPLDEELLDEELLDEELLVPDEDPDDEDPPLELDPRVEAGGDVPSLQPSMNVPLSAALAMKATSGVTTRENAAMRDMTVRPSSPIRDVFICFLL